MRLWAALDADSLDQKPDFRNMLDQYAWSDGK